MKIVDSKILRTRKEVEQICYKNDPGLLRKNDVCTFYMSYDNDPDTFEERWGIVFEENTHSLRILMLEGTGEENKANYPYYSLKASKFEGFIKPTKIRLDQALVVPIKYITAKKRHLLKRDQDELAKRIKDQHLAVRED